MAPAVESGHAGLTVALQTLAGFLYALLLVELGLGEKLVGKADDLLLDAEGEHFAMGNGEGLTHYLLQREAGACMALAHQGMTGKAFAPQEVGTEVAVADVGVRTVAVDAVGIGQEDANIVQQGRFLDEGQVKIQFRMFPGQGQGLVGHGTAMHQQNLLQPVVLGIILVNNC